MKENGSVPLTCPDGDQVIYFDNIGRYINKNYRVSKEKIKSADIISTTIHICLNNGGDSDDRGDDKPLQERQDLKPGNWRISDKHDLQLKMKGTHLLTIC